MTLFHIQISKKLFKKSCCFFLISVLFWNCGENKIEETDRPLNDSTAIEKVMDRFDLNVQYYDGKFWLMVDKGAKILVYKEDEKLKEFTLSDIRYGMGHFYITGGGFSTGFLLDQNQLVCFQHTPNQLKFVDIFSGQLKQTKELELNLKGKSKYIGPSDRKNALIQIIDKEEPKKLVLANLNIDKNDIDIILSEDKAFSSEDVLIKVFGPKIYILPQQTLKMWVFDKNSGEFLNAIDLPAFSIREYRERPKFDAENPFKWLELTPLERMQYKEDKYIDFFVNDGLLYLAHLIYSRDGEDSGSVGFYWSEIDLVSEKQVVGSFLDQQFIGFDGNGNFFILKDDPLKIIIQPVSEVSLQFD